MLVVEDDDAIYRLVATYLQQGGFVVDVAGEGETGLDLARTERPDVIVLDLMLPGIDGIEVCSQIRTSDADVLMLTARTEEIDRLIGLSVGADDYVRKPPPELIARIRVMLRRPRAVDFGDAAEPPRQFGALRVDPDGREVDLAGEPVDLTRTEFDLLDTLSARPRMAFSRRQLLEHVWGTDWLGDDHLVEVHVANLRRELGDDPQSPR